jgi:hypothetical protein
MPDHIVPTTAKRQWTIWLLAANGVLMTLVLAATVLWLVMPEWFRDLVIARSPVLSLAYRAAEGGEIMPSATGDLHLRFSPSDLLLLTADRLERGTPTQQAYAARHLGWLLYPKRKPHPHAVVNDPALKVRLLDGLVAAAHSTTPETVDAACFALLALGEDHRLPELLLLLDRLPGGRMLSLMPLRQRPDDPLVTTHLLKWYDANPEQQTLQVIVGQNDPRVDELMEMVLRSPSYGYLRHIALASPRAAFPARLATVRSLCSDSDPELIVLAMKILKAAPGVVELMLDVRCDPTAGLAHPAAEDYLSQHADGLSLEQRNRWMSAPPLPAKRTP